MDYLNDCILLLKDFNQNNFNNNDHSFHGYKDYLIYYSDANYIMK